jgi:hypothetical protein
MLLANHSHVPIKPEDILVILQKSRKTNKILYENKLVSTSGGFMVEEGGHDDRSPFGPLFSTTDIFDISIL